VISGDDYFTIDSNFPVQGAAFPVSGAIGPAVPLQGTTAVPEPA
jgi:hypothetical protein